jgi:hypothetical protein
MKIMLKWILNRMGGQWKRLGSGQAQVVAYCESISPNELSGFIICEEFFKQVGEKKLSFKTDCFI